MTDERLEHGSSVPEDNERFTEQELREREIDRPRTVPRQPIDPWGLNNPDLLTFGGQWALGVSAARLVLGERRGR